MQTSSGPANTEKNQTPADPPPAYDEKTYSNPAVYGNTDPYQSSTVPHTVVVCQPVAVGDPNSGAACVADYNSKASYGLSAALLTCTLMILAFTIVGYVFGTYEFNTGFQAAAHGAICGALAFVAAKYKRISVICAMFIFACISFGMGIGLISSAGVAINDLSKFDKEQNIFKPDGERKRYSQKEADVSVILCGCLLAATLILWVFNFLACSITYPTVKKAWQRCTCCNGGAYSGHVVSTQNSAQGYPQQSAFAAPPYTETTPSATVTPAV